MQHRRTKLVGILAATLTFLSILPLPGVGPRLSRAEAATTGCAPVFLIGARGAGETAKTAQRNMGGPIYDLFSRLQGKLGSAYVDGSGLAYDAVKATALVFSPKQALSSVLGGVDSLKSDILVLQRGCPTTKIVLAGYSEGAWVIHETLVELAASPGGLTNIAAVTMFGDPLFDPTLPSIDQGTYQQLYGVVVSHLLRGGAQKPLQPYLPTQLSNISHSYCLLHDPICNWAGLVSLVTYLPPCIFNSPSCQHYRYADKLTSDAAIWLASLLGTAQTTHGTLFLQGGVDQVALPTPVTIGAHVSITATGSLQYGFEGAAGCVGYPTTDPDGNRTLNGVPCDPKMDPLAPLPTAPIGALIARLGNTGSWQLVGSNGSITATQNGTLYFAYNDENRLDDSGGYTINYTIT